MFTVVMKTVSVITLLATMMIGTVNERNIESRGEIPDIRSDIRMSPIDGKVVPTQMNYQGYLILSADSTPVNGNLNMVFDLFISETGGSSFWSETHNNVQVVNGIFNIILGTTNTLDPDDFTGSPLWLQTTVGGEVLSPRKKIVSTAYSVRALYSDTADYVLSGTTDNDWTISGNVLFPFAQYGIAMYGNILYGSNINTHVNLGVACTTGTSGQNYTYCTVGGGYYNTSSGPSSTIGGGAYNTSSGSNSTLGAGCFNTSSGASSTIGGGAYNTSSGSNSTLGAGCFNTSSGASSTIGGGAYNTSSGSNSTIGGGAYNTSSGFCSTIPGGYCVNVSGDYSYGFGRGINTTSFDVADNYDVVFGDGGTYDYEFGINRENPSYPLHIGTDATNGNGAYLTIGGVWTNGCSRTFKENFVKPDPEKILELVKKLDVFRYNYKEDEGVYHISPVAEDFYDLFKTGSDNRYLAGMDVSGVALLAIKALVKENEEIAVEISQLNIKIDNLTSENLELNSRIDNVTSENQELRSEIEQMRADIDMLKGLNN